MTPSIISELLQNSPTTVFEDDVRAVAAKHNKKIAAHNRRVNAQIAHALETGEDRARPEEPLDYIQPRKVMQDLEGLGIEVVRNNPRMVHEKPRNIANDPDKRAREVSAPISMRRNMGAPRTRPDDIVQAMLDTPWKNIIDLEASGGTAREGIALRTRAKINTAETLSLRDYNIMMTTVMISVYDGYSYQDDDTSIPLHKR